MPGKTPFGADLEWACAALVRDLVTLTMGISQGTTATLQAVVRPEPDVLWLGLAPRNQPGERYALRTPLLKSDGSPRTYDDVLLVLRRSESLRRHDRGRFDELDVVGQLHGCPVRNSGDFVDDPPLESFQDSLRTTLLTAAFRGTAPLPPAGTTRLVGFAWLLDAETQWVRLYLDSPADPGTLGVDLDVGHGAELVPELMNRLDEDLPAAWEYHETDPDPFCRRLFDLRHRTDCR
ncbi:hypothetical protein CDG81_02425 [Actinopolyspora erythraea]|uniref:Uncharacterized protein n=1 Tax=Actinopolyspora erythraea TaxID=414996 RepID=A0A099D273_9ACTN|nr:hypothetical protein [Actinopolyspora erythraea]ASU77356.1 hypothetical protein CDG81_02425 [Actinopolyspora erythraea]KGI80149.1 hypothetical protein IL38_18555 [Actinopolyspora erythraea]